MAAPAVLPLAAQENGTPQSSVGSDQDQAEEKQINVRYAQAYLKLMEAQLAEFQQRNQRSPNTIRPEAMQLAAEYVAKARERLRAAQSDEANESAVYVLAAEAEVRAAEAELQRAAAVNRQRAGTISRGEVARLQAQLELAKVKVVKARHLASESPLSNLRFEIDQLREDVQQLLLQQAKALRGA
ncbi:MAG: hypothetical protein DWQ37_02380 [Planctomycetota bacterium]|nr:MAG: hypothetical protein DWQ37_02380 [Planctomycetota bacterium]